MMQMIKILRRIILAKLRQFKLRENNLLNYFRSIYTS